MVSVRSYKKCLLSCVVVAAVSACRSAPMDAAIAPPSPETMVGEQAPHSDAPVVRDRVASSTPGDALGFADEFSASGKPDSRSWSFERGFVRNGELQYFSDRPENVRVVDGYLVLEARRDFASIDGLTREYSSASITTMGKRAWRYARVDVRAKLPEGLGIWPAIWMLPTSFPAEPWPEGGEIDIMEAVGHDPGYVYTSLHTAARNHQLNEGIFARHKLPESGDGFHLYSIDWQPGRIDFLLDGVVVFTQQKQSTDTKREWPYDDSPFFLLVSLSFGGGWGGSRGLAPESLPQRLILDYVRVTPR